MAQSSYEIPRWGTGDSFLLGWLLEAQQDGEAWLKAQYPAMDWEKALRAISGPDDASGSLGPSQLSYRRTKRTVREMVASLAQFQHYGEYKTVWDQTLYDQANVLTNLDKHWLRNTKIHAAHRAGIQFGVAFGTTYFHQVWNNHFHNRNRGDISLEALSPQDVTFVQMPKDHDIQKAYAVIIREELPINLARRKYAGDNAAFAAGLVADREQPGWLAKGLQKLQQFVAPALRVAGRMSRDDQASFPTVDIFHMYTLDGSLNDGPVPVKMGPQRANWSYMVPALGDPLPTGQRNPMTGNEFTYPAGPDDCLMFPLRRYTIFSKTGVCYDGTSPWWHGQVPLARLRFGDWAWEALGCSQAADIISIEQGIVALMRLIEDNHAARLDPPLIFDDTVVSRTWAEALSGRKAGARAAAPLQMGDPVKPLLPPEYYHVDAGIYSWIEQQENRMDYLSGVRDLVAIAKAQQITGADAMEKLLEMAGPIVQELVRGVSDPLTELGEMRKALYFQFYTRARMITTVGPEGVEIDAQYTPEQLVQNIVGESSEARTLRTRRLLEDFYYAVSKSGINEINRMSTKLLYLQLYKLGAGSGMPIISRHTLASVAEVPNYGPPPKGTNNEQERIVAEQRMAMEMQIELAQELAAAQGQMGVGAGPANPSGGMPTPSGQQGPGRPPSYQEAPRLVSKDGGTRTTVATS